MCMVVICVHVYIYCHGVNPTYRLEWSCVTSPLRNFYEWLDHKLHFPQLYFLAPVEAPHHILLILYILDFLFFWRKCPHRKPTMKNRIDATMNTVTKLQQSLHPNSSILSLRFPFSILHSPYMFSSECQSSRIGQNHKLVPWFHVTHNIYRIFNLALLDEG